MTCWYTLFFFFCSFFFICFFFFFNDTATTEIYTLSLHDALPISCRRPGTYPCSLRCKPAASATDRKSTRLNSSHANISYAVFCLKKKKTSHNGSQKTLTTETIQTKKHEHIV